MPEHPFSRHFWRKRPRLARASRLFAIFALAFVGGLGYAAWALVCRAGACPSIGVLTEWTPPQTSKLYGIDGRFIAEIGLERRTVVKLREIPKVVQDAFVVTEDKRFYDHAGIDWVRVPTAVLRNVQAGGWVQGFSTITMQLARNVFPERISREKSVTRKLKEAKVARQIEAKLPKDRILELYLNQINLGNGAYGVETASQRYFGKSVRDLNLSEAALLAALPKAPGRYNPRRFPDRAVQRRNTVIELMRKRGVVNEADARLAKAYPLQLARREESGEMAPYFVEWVRRQLDDQFGDKLYKDGLKVFTTLDVDMQSAAERALERQIKAIEGGKYGAYRHLTYEKYIAQNVSSEENTLANTPYLQGAFVAMDPRNGHVRALIGGRDFEDSKFNRAVQALRQPGSTFKPLVYAEAIRNGRPPSYVLEDEPLTVPAMGDGDWTPQNFDAKFEGPIPLRRALYMSRNLPTVRLGMELGEASVIESARRFGISTPIPPYPSIHLGAAGVYPIELIAGYSAFSTLGIRATPIAILRVENQRGDVLWEPTTTRSEVLSREEAWLMVDMLEDVVRRGTASGAVRGSGFRVPSGGKTGTTNDGTDVWYVGFTPDLVAGVWMGLDKPQKIKSNAQGGILAAPAWAAFMTEVYQRKPAPPDWPRPEAIVVREIDRTTNLLQNPFCPREVVGAEFFIPGTEPIRECDAHSPFTSPYDSTGLPLGPAPEGTNTENRVIPGAAPIPTRSRDTGRIVDPFKIPRR